MKKKTNKKAKHPLNFNFYLYLMCGICATVLVILGIAIKLNEQEPEEKEETTENPSASYIVSDEPQPALIDDGRGELIEDYSVPTFEEVDGGLFQDKDTGLTVVQSEYADLGWSEEYNTSTPEAFKNDTLNKCIIANNLYGAQCVSLARVFWWSYADRDVSTCGTGMAKGMMNCYEQNAGEDFLVYWSTDKNEIQAGDWLVFDGGKYGHVGMALGPVNDGYVALLGENQGGRACEGGGSATNIININIKNLIGFYRAKAYVKPEPVEPEAPDTGIVK